MGFIDTVYDIGDNDAFSCSIGSPAAPSDVLLCCCIVGMEEDGITGLEVGITGFVVVEDFNRLFVAVLVAALFVF